MGAQQFDFLDALTVCSFLLGYENLMEDRQQSKHNDVSAANDRQASFLLDQLTARFEEQNEMLRKILKAVKR